MAADEENGETAVPRPATFDPEAARRHMGVDADGFRRVFDCIWEEVSRRRSLLDAAYALGDLEGVALQPGMFQADGLHLLDALLHLSAGDRLRHRAKVCQCIVAAAERFIRRFDLRRRQEDRVALRVALRPVDSRRTRVRDFWRGLRQHRARQQDGQQEDGRQEAFQDNCHRIHPFPFSLLELFCVYCIYYSAELCRCHLRCFRCSRCFIVFLL